MELDYSRASIRNKTVNATNAPTSTINSMTIKLKDGPDIGTCIYYYDSQWTFWGRIYTRELRNINITTEVDLRNETEITITGTQGINTYTINTTIENLINESNLSFNK